MSLLEQLFSEYGCLNHDQLNKLQVKALRDQLKEVPSEEIVSPDQARCFLSLLRAFREYVADSAKLNGENYPALLRSLLSVGEDGVYSDKLRFIFELIQNVDDCKYENAEDCTLDIHFNFNNNRIRLRYNETGFTPFNVFAITGIAEAAKNISSGTNEIGEKGIGFKSVFGVAHKVLIRSGWFSFELHKDNFTIPIESYPDEHFCRGTEMTLFVAPGVAQNIYNEIKDQYCKREALFAKNPLLFLNNLTKLRLYYDCFRTMTFEVTRSAKVPSTKFWREDNVRLSVSLHNAENGATQDVEERISCTRYSYSVVFSKSACKSRYGDNTKVGDNGGKAMTLHAIFPNPEDLETVGNGALYSFLPTSLRFTVPMVCHVPFKLGASREFADPQENKVWFHEACHYFSELLDYAYFDWSRTVKTDIVSYLPGITRNLFAENNGKEKCLSTQAIFNGSHFSNMPIFYTANGNYVNLQKIFCFDPKESIVDQKCAYHLLAPSRELFIPPVRANTQGTGIYTERNVYQRLFAIALKDSARTRAILEYLASTGYQPEDNEFPAEPFELDSNQFCLLVQYGHFSQLFLNHAKKNILSGKRPIFSLRNAAVLPIQDALYKDFHISEAPKTVEKYLGYCQEKCVLLEIAADQYLPCHNALILSKDNPLSSFSTFCYSIDSHDTFSIRMKHKEISDRLNELSESSRGSADDYLRELRNNRLLGRDAIGPVAYRNYIDLILRSGTTHTRFIQELLQNADDCDYADGVVPEFRLSQINSKLFTEYNEVGFTRGNIRSITAIGESTKNHLLRQNAAKIGEKGVGFKTIFAIASRVEIHSGEYHFSLADKSPTIPDLLAGSFEPVTGTRMVLSIKDGKQLTNYKEQDILELCLCLRRLRKITINNTVVTIEDNDSSRIITINKRQYTFTRFVHRFTVSDQALQERENGLRSISSKQRITIYVPEKGAAKEYPLYCGLPTKHRIKVPLVIDAPFMLTTSREEIESGSHLWNTSIRNELYTAILSVIDLLKHSERSKILRYVRFIPRLQGAQRVYHNEISDCQFINDYDFLTAIRNANILPTFDPEVFVSAQSRSALRFPEVANYLFAAGYFGSIPKQSILDISKDDTNESALNAINCPEVAFSRVYPVLSEYSNSFIKDAEYRQQLYAYLLNAPDEYRDSIKELSIIPVYSSTGGQTEFIAWEDEVLFVKKQCAKSEHNYWILNVNYLPKADCEKIFGEYINEMNAEWERSRYNDHLRDIIHGHDMEEIYRYLLNQFSIGAFQKYQSQEILLGMKEFIPLKNQLGNVVDTGLFICKKVTGYFQSRMILAMSVHDECRKFADYLKCGELANIHYQDIRSVEALTQDDVDDFIDDYFVNGEEILRNYYRDGKLSDELVAEYGLGYIAMQSSQDDEYLEFPENPVKDIARLRSHIQTELRNPMKIVKVKVERTVHKYSDSSGNMHGIDDNNVRKQTLTIYSPEGVYGRCFCQMCRKVKPYDLMEVNNLIADPEYFFHQTRVALCLECSKSFEAIRSSNAHKRKNGMDDPILSFIRGISIGTAGCIDVPITKDKTIRFTATHLAEIQEILRGMPK